MGTTDKKDREHVFYSAGVNFRIVRFPTLEEIVNGQLRTIRPEVVHDFTPGGGIFRTRPGEHVYPTGPDGADEDAIDFLRRSPALNQAFWEEGLEPDRLLPTERDFTEELIAATARSDIDAILALRAQEATTHKRPALLDGTEYAMAQLAPEVEVPSVEELERAAQEETAAAAGLSG